MKNTIDRFFTSCILVALLVSIYALPTYLFSLASFIVLLYILIYEWPALCKNSLALKMLTPFYLILPFLYLILLHSSIYKQLIMLLYILIASFDTGSYAVGKCFGRSPIAPKISPGKTWQGFAGGIISTFATAIMFLWYKNISFSYAHFLSILITCFLALLGDFFESSLKRTAGIKDSGSILPGHGGLLDRFDSLFFTLPLFFFLRKTLFTLFFS